MKSNGLKKLRNNLKYVTAFWLLLFSGQIFGQTPNEPQTLQPNETLTREMTGAETHRYKFDLKANEFFQIRVEQKGVDIQLKLSDEKGNVLSTMDSPNGKEGSETLTFVANENKAFQLEVISPHEKAEKGNYIISRADSRISAPQDKRRVEVERIFVEGIKARNEGQSETGITKFEEALKGWEEFQDGYLIEVTKQQIKQLTINKYLGEIFGEYYAEMRKAQELLADGQQLMGKSKSDALPARKKLTEALSINRALNEKLKDKSIIEKINRKGDFSSQLNDIFIFIKFLSKSGEALSLDGISTTHYNLNEWNENINLKKQAIAVYREILSDNTFSTISKANILSIKNIEATAYADLGGNIGTFLGNKDESLKYLFLAIEKYRALYEETKEPKFQFEIAQTSARIGMVYDRESKEYEKSIEFYNKAIEIYRNYPEEKFWLALSYNSLATRHSENFNYKSALETWEKALELYKQIDYKLGQVSILKSIAHMYRIVGNTSKTKETANQMLKIAMSEDFVEKSKTVTQIEAFNDKYTKDMEYFQLAEIVAAYLLLEDYPKSLEYCEKAVESARSRNHPRDIGLNLWWMAFIFEKQERWDKAAEYYKQSLEINKISGNQQEVAGDLSDIGKAYFELKNFTEALKYLNDALMTYNAVEVNENKSFNAGFSTSLIYLSRTHYALGNKQLAVFYGKRAVNAMQNERQRLQNLDVISQKGFLEKKEKHYRRLADWLFEDGRFAEAEEVLRMLKEEEFSRFVRRDPEEINKLSQRIDLNSGEKKALEKYSALADNLAKIGVEYEKIKTEKGVNCQQDVHCRELDEQLKNANQAFKRFLTELEIEFNKVPKRNVRDEIDTERSRQANLQKWNAVSIYTLVGEERLRVFLTTPQVQTDRKKEIKDKELNTKIADFRKALTDPNVDPRPLGKELYDILIAPIEKQIKDSGAKTLLFSLDGTLRYIPIAALWDGEKYLVEKYQIVLLTSKTREKLTDENKAEWTIFGGGVTEKSDVTEPERKSFNGLPSVKKELDSIIREDDSAGFFAGKKFINETFTQESLEGNLSGADFNVLHLATHFKLGRDDKTSFLLLGNNKTLTLDEISNSNIRFDSIDLVVLSACETAFGTSSGSNGNEGGEIDSSATFFELKGAKSVVASLWSVADNSTGELMIAFYGIRRENPKLSKAEALRLAQIKLLNGKYKTDENPKWRGTEMSGTKPSVLPAFKTDENAPFAHPYYWSPFILIGNWK